MKIWLPTIRGEGGTDVFTRRLAQALCRRGHEAEVSWFNSRFQIAPHLLRSVRPPDRTEIIHANSWNGFAFAHPGIPLVITEHLNIFDSLYRSYKSLAQGVYHQFFIRRFVRASLSGASAITAVSHATAASLRSTWGRLPSRVIHNWINTNDFSPQDGTPHLDRDLFHLLFVGNLSRRKGTDLLAPMMRRLGNNFRLSFTTGLRRSQSIPAESNMISIGRIVEESFLVQAYQRCDATLVPSRFEGFGLSALEAMACGKPVVASRIASLAEIVEDGVTGILCPVDDVTAFVAACRKLAESPSLRLEYGQAARRRTLELFSEDVIIPRYVALYRELAG
jgi:glycosyltransferase involved in cell wall biosynthesis